MPLILVAYHISYMYHATVIMHSIRSHQYRVMCNDYLFVSTKEKVPILQAFGCI